MTRKLIDKEELLNFPTEEYSGFCNFVYDLIQKHDFLDREDDAMNLAEDIFDGIMNVIETAEVVEAEPIRYGKWLPVDDKNDAFDCSECDAMVMRKHNYCPKCGAKMK